MENVILVDHENIPLVTHHDEYFEGDHDDYDNYNTPATSKEDEAMFTNLSPPSSRVTFRQKVNEDKLIAL